MAKNQKNKTTPAPPAATAESANTSAPAATVEATASMATITESGVTVNAETASPATPAENTETATLVSPPPVLTAAAPAATQASAAPESATAAPVPPEELPPVSSDAADREGETPGSPDKHTPLWPNFNEPPPGANVQAMNATLAKNAKRKKEEAKLVLLDGYGRFQCLRDNGSGKYRQGKTYILPVGQHPELFRKVD